MLLGVTLPTHYILWSDVSERGYRVAVVKTDTDRRKWLLEQLAIEAAMYAHNEAKTGDFRLARGFAFLEMAWQFDLISTEEQERVHDALLGKNPAVIRELLHGPAPAAS